MRVIRDLAREHGPAAITRLVELMNSDDETVAVAACRVLLDRGYGKPPQEIAVTPLLPFDGEPAVITDAAEAARTYERIMRGDLAPDAVRFEPAALPALEAPPAAAAPGEAE